MKMNTLQVEQHSVNRVTNGRFVTWPVDGRQQSGAYECIDKFTEANRIDISERGQ